MKKFSYFLLLLVLAFSAENSSAQQCSVFASGAGSIRNKPFPYICTGDTITLFFYSSGSIANQTRIHWGDGDTTNLGTVQQTTASHVFTQAGVFYPYYVLTGGFCGDTILPFSVFGNINPIDSSMGQNVNFFQVSDSCVITSGRAYIDKNSNCAFSSLDIPLPNKKVKVTYGSFSSFVYTDNMGLFTFNGPPNPQLTLDSTFLPVSLLASCGTASTAGGFSPNTSRSFVFTCSGGFDLSIHSYTSLLAQTVDRPIWFEVKNNGCDTAFNPVVNISYGNRINPNTSVQVAIYQNGTSTLVTPTFAGNIATIPGVTLPPFSSFSGSLNVRANPMNTTLGDTVCIGMNVSHTAGDVNVFNNYDTICMNVVTSYDPNDKQASINGANADGLIDPNKTISYQIRFQNTGNFPARDVRVTDTISTLLNLETFALTGTSHNVNVQRVGRAITFYFDEIWLADSASNEPESHGFINFTIAQNPNLTPGTQIKNFVDIYFDYNEPVRTNTTVSVIREPNSISEEGASSLDVYPNPASSHLWIKGEHTISKISITDIQGKVHHTQKLDANMMRLSLDGMPSGVYIVEVEEQSGAIKREKLAIVK
jgi:uncharacterized repeat protein (TIGR01451 family)